MQLCSEPSQQAGEKFRAGDVVSPRLLLAGSGETATGSQSRLDHLYQERGGGRMYEGVNKEGACKGGAYKRMGGIR